MEKSEKMRRRNISRQYIRDQEVKESLRLHPMCDGNSWMCDNCKRYSRGCGLHPFTPLEAPVLQEFPAIIRALSTDSMECEGYL